MKTSRIFRIFMMALDTVVLFFLRIFRKFTHLTTYEKKEYSTDDLPHAVAETHPDVLGIKPVIEVDGEVVSQYHREEPIFFDPEAPYTERKGVLTFRGNNVRGGGTYGNAALKEKKLKVCWSIETGKLKKQYGNGYWTGSGWTGQPLLIKWEEHLKPWMNLYEKKAAKEGLVEVIYSTMDGKVYFLDLADGSKTRDEIQVGLPFKGAGALDPREIPLLYLGPGDGGPNPDDDARAYVYRLTDGQKVLEYGRKDPFAPRIFHGYDSSPLIDKNTDTLIEPGENGIIYTAKLGTEFNLETGELTLSPSNWVKFAYTTNRSSEEAYWLGMEDSAAVWKNYLYIADNGGNLLCIDMNTMQVIWAADVADDTNGSPVLEIEDGCPYIYIATSLHWKAGKLFKLGDVPIFKFHAITGQCVWKRTYLCNTVAGISGGIQATCLSGKHSIEDLLIIPVARTPQVRTGILVALDKKTGKEVWKRKMKRYTWSSPVAIYDEEGQAVIVIGDSSGRMSLLDGRTGKMLDQIKLGSNIEATPAVFEDMLVAGTRGQKIFGVKIV